MTIQMPDSITPANLPAGFPAYLAYTDGDWPTAAEVRKMFPAAHILTLTVTGRTVADGCDIEKGDLTPQSGAAYLAGRIKAGAWRPVGYASRDTMPELIDELMAIKVQRSQVRLLSAHYGDGEHICGPAPCGLAVAMDGTQWTDAYAGVGGRLIDMSLLTPGFFGTTPPPTNWQEAMLKALPILRQGATGQEVGNVQALLVAHGYGYLLTRDPGAFVVDLARITSRFDAGTTFAVRKFQEDRRLGVDGIVGPQTWPALLDV